MNATYDATWIPVRSGAGSEDKVALAAEYVEQLCINAGQRGTLLTLLRGDAKGTALEQFARRHVHSTLRSGRASGGPVLVDMLDIVLLAKAHGYARGRSLCALESGAFSLEGWATATRAVDLTTDEQPAPLNTDVVKLFEHLLFAGNNGWADKPGERDARRLLGEIAVAAPALDADFVAGYVIGKGAFDTSAKQLHGLAKKIMHSAPA